MRSAIKKARGENTPLPCLRCLWVRDTGVSTRSFGLVACDAHFVEAGTAIDRAVFRGQERDLSLIPALGADDRVHLARGALAGTATTAARRVAAIRPAGRAAGRLVQQPLLLVKFLFACSEDEIAATVAALESFVNEVQPGTSLVICWYSLPGSISLQMSPVTYSPYQRGTDGLPGRAI